MATGTYKINTANGGATVYQNPDNTVTVASGDKKWTGSHADFNSAYGSAANANPNANVSITNLGTGRSATLSAGATANASAGLPTGMTSFDTSAGKDLTKIDYGSYGDESGFGKAIAEANSKAAAAQAETKKTIEAATKLQADTKKSTDAVTAGQTQAAVNAEMGKDATQTGGAASETSATDAYGEMLDKSLKTPAGPTAEENAKAVADAEAEGAAIDNQLKAAELARQKAESENNALMAQRAEKDITEAKAEAQYANDKLELERSQLAAKQARAESEARRDVYNQEQIAKLQMGKLGLVGSGSALATFQSIATNGITKLSEIQADYSLASAKIALEAKRESDKLVYDLNKIADSWTEKRIDSNLKGAQAIAEYQKNKTMNQITVKKNIEKTLKDLKDEKREDEKFYLSLAKEREEHSFTTAERLRVKAEREEAKAKDSINTLISTGAWANKTPEEKAKFEKDSGLPVGTADLLAKQASSKDFQSLVDKQDLKGYFPSEAATSAFSRKVDEYLQKGLDRTDAVNRAFGFLAQNDPNLKAAIAKATATKAGGSGDAWKKGQTVELTLNGETQEWEMNDSQAARANAEKQSAILAAEKSGKTRQEALFAGDKAFSNFVQANASPIRFKSVVKDDKAPELKSFLVEGRQSYGEPVGAGKFRVTNEDGTTEVVTADQDLGNESARAKAARLAADANSSKDEGTR